MGNERAIVRAESSQAAGFNSQGFGVRGTGLALIASLFYSFARVSAVLKLNVDDYYHNGPRRRVRSVSLGRNPQVIALASRAHGRRVHA